MSDHFLQEGLKGVFFCRFSVILHGICHSCTDIFHVKLYIPEVKYKKRKIKGEKYTSEQMLFFSLNFLRQRGWSCYEKNIRYQDINNKFAPMRGRFLILSDFSYIGQPCCFTPIKRRGPL